MIRSARGLAGGWVVVAGIAGSTGCLVYATLLTWKSGTPGSLRSPRSARPSLDRDSPGRIEDGNFGDHRSVAGGVSELRIHAGAGYRVYYTIRRTTIVAVLSAAPRRASSATSGALSRWQFS